jgi:chromosome segregation ATPase
MTEHDERAQELEAELDEMEERSDRLEEDVSDAREDWERKKADSSVPGAVGEPEPDEDDRELDPRDPANEDL